ncbi:chaplin family protein [Spirillospora albida]|uniref:chaplin family protein n=1 Tax=Spirillospora albida TaxID=58123 RepID=UPI0006895AE6|nr:chaplin family protein [Spirillospora albida]
MRSTSRAAVLAASFVALGVSAVPANAFAGITGDGPGILSGQNTFGERGVASGNQISAPISLPVNVCGNAVGVAGTAVAGCEGGAKVKGGSGGTGQSTSGKRGVASGNQVDAPASVPVNICGNAVGAVGTAAAGCEGGGKVEGGGFSGARGGQRTDGSGGVASGNQINAPISLPMNICGNAVGVIGTAAAGCEGGGKVKNGGPTGTGQRTSGVAGIGAGNQVNAPVSAPIDLCGNAVGNAAAGCEGGASVRNGGHRSGKQVTDGTAGVLAGNQANAPISIPITACGNAAAVLGAATGLCEGGADVRSGSGAGQASGAAGVGAGNQANGPTPGEAPSHLHNTLNALGQPVTAYPAAPEAPLSLHPRHFDAADAALRNVGEAPMAQSLPEPAAEAPHKAGAELPQVGDVPAVRGLPRTGAVSRTGGAEAVVVPLSLPVEPQAGARESGAGLPHVGDVPAVRGLPRTGAVSRSGSAPRVMTGSFTRLGDDAGRPAIGGLPAVGGLPRVDGVGEMVVPLSLPVRGTSGLPQAGGLPSATGLPRTGTVSRTVTPAARVPGVVLSPVADGGRHGTDAPVARGGRTPKVPGQELPAGPLPAEPGAPAVGGAGAELPLVGGKAEAPRTDVGVPVAVAPGAGDLRPVSAPQSLASATRTGTVWAVGLAGVLACVTGALALTRRMVLGRR